MPKITPLEIEKRSFHAELESLLRSDGFKFLKTLETFRKKIDHGVFVVGPQLIYHAHRDYHIVLHFVIRVDEVEDVYNTLRWPLIEGLISKSELRYTSTIGLESGRLINEHQQRWAIDKEASGKTAAKSIFEFFQEHGRDFFGHYGQLENIYQELHDDRTGTIFPTFDRSHRAVGAVVLGRRLNKSPDEIDRLISDKRSYLEKCCNNKSDLNAQRHYELFTEFLSSLD